MMQSRERTLPSPHDTWCGHLIALPFPSCSHLLTTTGMFFISVLLSLQKVLYKWNHTVHNLWVKLLSHVWLCNPMDYIVHGILQARIMEWVAFLFSRVSSQPRDWTQVSHIIGRFFTRWATREAQEYWSGWKWSRSVVSDSLQPVDYSLLGSSVHGILQARILPSMLYT